MAHKKLQATATLFLDTSNAQSDAKKFVNDIKQKLAEVETAADKMSVFKDVVGYIAQIDRALTTLKAKNSDAFNSAFGNLDTDLKKQLEGIFGVDGTKLGQLDVLREKLNSLTPKSSIKEIRNFAKEINSLFSSVGLDKPFDDINEQFSGRTTTKHIQDLAVTLAKFSNVWDDVSSRIAGGFGVGGTGSGSGGFSGPSKAIQEEIDKLKKQKEDITSLIKQIKEVTKMSSAWEDGDTINLDFEATEEAAQKLIDKFKQLDDAINNNEFDDKSIAYAEALTERAKIALQLIEINNQLTKTDRNGNVIQSSPDFLKNFLADNADGDNIVNYAIEDFAAEAEDQLENLRQESTNTTKQINELKTSVRDVFGAAGNVPASDAFENIGHAAENAGDKVDTFSKKVDNLNESIKKVYMSALDLEVDTRNGDASGKEFMNLFSADGVVSTTEGIDYHVDTDTLVQQLVANLNRNIVMSLHNHANGDMTFSPSDINSFAKMYYGQGTKINGIIANGFIHTIDFNSIGQEVAIQIAQDYQDGIQHLFEAKNIAQFASFENGSIVPSDLLKQAQVSNPEYYQEIIDQLQEAQMTVLRQAFEKNGAEFTLQSFGLDNIDELSTYLANVQKNTQNAIEPVEKLKNLISTLRPDVDLSEFTDVFDKFKSGAIDGSQALSKVLDLTSIDETNQKLREQEQLLENVKVAIKNGIGEAVGLDNMVMTLEVIEQEIKDGVLTSLEDCITRFREFNNINGDGSLEFVGKREHVIPDYYGTYLLGEDEVISSEEINKLRQLSNQQEQLYQNLRSAIKGMLSDVVDVDDMTYAFDTIEKEIQTGLLTTLDQCIEKFKFLTSLDDKRLAGIQDGQRVADEWDFYRGDISSDDYEAAERAAEAAQQRASEAEADALRSQEEANTLREDLVHEREYANELAGDLAVANERIFEQNEALHRALDENVELQNRNEQLETKLAVQQEQPKDVVDSNEVLQLETLQQKLLEVRQAVDDKTKAFEEEYVTVDAAVDAEIASLNKLKDVLTEIQEILQIVFSVSKINVGDVELTQSKENVNAVSGAIQTIEQTLGQILAVLQGFTGLEADGKNSITHKEATVKSPVNTADATEHLTSKLSDVATESTLSQIPAAIKNLADAVLNNIRYNKEESSKTNENIHYVTDPQGNPVTMYRGIRNTYGGLVSNRYHGGTFSTDNIELAKEYAGELGKVEKVLLSMKNPLEIDGRGAFWNQIEYIGDNSDEASQKLHELNATIKSTKQLLSEAEKIPVTDKELKNIKRGLMTESDTKREREISYWTKELEKAELEKAAILSDANNPYGKKNTNELVEIAKAKGYDGVIFKNIIDSATGDIKDISTVMVTFEQEQIHYLETISSTFESAVNSLKTHYGDLAQHITASSDEIESSIRQMIELRGKVSSGEISDDEYQSFLSQNAIARNFDDLAAKSMIPSSFVEGALNGEDFDLRYVIKDITNFIEDMKRRFQNVAKTFGKEGLPFDQLLNTSETAIESQSVTESDEALSEISQLDKLQNALVEVKNAVIAKTKAFVDEGNVVGQTVGKEIAALMKLSEVVNNIVPKVGTLVENLKNVDISKLGAISTDIKTGSDVVTQDAPSTDPFKAKLSKQTGVFTRYRKDIKDVDYLTEDLEKQIDSLGISLREVANQSELDAWIKRFNNLKENVQAAKSEFEQMNLGTVNLFQRELTNSFSKLTLPQREGMLQEYLQAIVLLDKQKQAVKDGHAVEIAAIKEITAALQAKINAQIESNKAAKDAANIQKKNGNFGSTASINATAKYNSLTRTAGSEQFANSSDVAAALVQYEQSYKNMIAMRDRLRNQDVIDDSDRETFKQATIECNAYASALDKLIKNTMKLKGSKVNPDDYMLGSDFNYSDIEQRKAVLADFVQQTYGLSVAAEDFKDGWNKVVFAVDNGDGTFTQMTATFTAARNEIVALAGDTNKVQSKLQSFIDGVKNRLQSLSQYFIATIGIYDVWNVVKQGIQHVREIDSALTELKKVTDATDISYKNFLQDMAKTGSVIGATVKDLTTMAAEWARLGYSLEESGKLAESTAILLNVSEFQDATAASEALISTMQAFQYTADESGHVVDILNEVGNNYAVSSDGIATALQDSASALMEGGNNLEQAVALVASANKVVQDPNSVGSALRTISLRLRGTSVEVLEEMGEETDGVAESTSKLQEKLKALTGVDIVDMNGAYKDTYTILKEIGSVWKDLDPMDQAAALELMAGKNRANTLAAILNNMKDLEGAYNDAIKAEGSALKENQAYLDSIQGRIDLFNNSVQTMWMNLLDTDVIKSIVNLGTEFIQFLDSSAGRVTALGAALSILGKVLKIAPVISSANGQLQILGKTVETIKNNFSQLSEQSTGAFGKIKSAFTSVFTDPSAGKIDLSGMLSEDSFNEKLNGLISGFNNIDQSINAISWDDYVNGVSKSDQAMGAALKTCTSHNGTIIAGTNAYQAYTGAATTAAVGTSTVGGAAQATTGKLIAMKVAALAANAALTMGLSLIISLAIKGVTAWANAGEAAREAAQDAVNASEELREQNESLKDYKDQIKELRTELDNNTLSESEAYDAREKLLTIQNELIDKFGLERDGINLVTGAINDQIAAIDALSQKDAQQWLNTHKSEYLDAIEYFDSDNQGSFMDHWYEGFGVTRISNYAVPDDIKKLISDFALTQDNMDTWTDNLGFHNVDFNGSVEEVKNQVDDFILFLNEQEKRLNAEINNAEVDGDLGLADTLRADLKALQDYQKDIGTEYVNWFGDNSTYASNKAVMEEAQYQTAMAKYVDQYMAILDAQNKLTEAQSKGDPKDIKTAIKNYKDAIDKAIGDADETWMDDYFNSFADGLATQEFEINVKLNEDGLQDELAKIVQAGGEKGLSSLDNNQILDMINRDLNVEGTTDISGQYTDEQISGLIALQSAADNAGIEIIDLIGILTNFGIISGRVADNITDTVVNSTQTYSELSTNIESYNNILSQTSEIVSDNTEVTQEYKDSLKALGISEEELGECFDENNGLIVKNAAALRKLVAEKKKDKQATVQQAKAMSQLQYKNTVQQLQQVVKAMAVEVRASGLVSSAALKTSASLREQLVALKQTIQQYALLEISLSDAANAYSEFEAAKERDAQLTYGDSMIEMLQTINEGFKTGQVGTEAFQYAVKVIVPESEYAHIDNIEQRMIAIHDYIDKNPLFADWFTIDEGEFSITLDNINSFIDDAFGAGLFTNDSSGSFFLTEAIKNAEEPLKEFADQLGKAFNTEVTEGSVLAMLAELEKYDASWGNILTDLTTTPIDRAINDATTALEEALTAQEEFIRSSGDLNSDQYIELEEAVSAARGALDKASQAAIDNAQTYIQVEAVLKGMTGEVKYTQEQADALARSLGLINENGHIQIDAETGALILTKEQLDVLNERLIGLTKPTILDVQLAYDEIDRQLQELNAYLSDPSNYGGTILTELNITNEGEAKAKVDELTADRDAIQLVYNITTTSTEEAGTFEKLTTWEANGVQITISGDASAFEAIVNETNAVEMDGKTVPIDADPTEANASMDTVDNRELEDKEPGIYMQGVGYALDDIDSIHDALQALTDRDIYVNVHYREDGAVMVNGTAHVDGTAYSNGNWGAPRTEVALTGELGPEMVVRDGRWFTVGENGAEFTQIKKGDIIFNHKQTENLLSKGYVTSRGKAYASGTIPNTTSGTAYYETFGGYVGDDDVFENGSDNWMDPWTNSFDDIADDLSDAADSISDAADDAEQVVDFIEMKLEEIEAIIEKTTTRIANFLDDTTSIKNKDELYDELVKAEKDKSEAYLKAAQKYNVQAAAALSGVPQQYQEMARNGAIAIEEFLGEDQVEIAEKIEEYRDWAAKADEAENGHLEAIAAISAHRVEQLEDIATDFENIIGISKSHSDLLQAEMDFIEESGGRLSEDYYEELKKHSQKQLDDMQAERVALQKILDDSVAAGDVVIGSDDWYSMLETIYEVDQEIIDCKISLEEFQNAINELYWDNFDKFITEIDNVDSELSNLYDLISDDDKIVDDMGNWTDEGVTALGLLAQQMENAQFKSKEYGDAIAKLKKDYAAGLYSVDEYNERLADLTDSQYDAIKSYEDAKDAIVDLNKTRVDAVKDGLQKEIDAYSELIEKQKESLNSDKEAREFEKQVQESDKNIKDIERKIAALQGNTSSSAMAQRKRLEAELLKAREELNDLYYDHSIEKQQEALDKELEDYTKNKEDQMDALDEYLKKEEQVISDSFDLVAENTKAIADTLIQISEEYGVTISDTVATPWINGANAIGIYEEQLNTSVSATTKNLNTLKKQLEDLQIQADKTAESIVNTTHSTIANTNDGHQTSIKGYANGTKSVEYDQWAIIDELGDELQLVPDESGRLDYIKKGTGILNNTLTENLIDLAVDPTNILEKSRPVIGVPGIDTINNTFAIDASIGTLLHVEHLDGSNPAEVAKLVDAAWEKKMQTLNNSMKKFTR